MWVYLGGGGVGERVCGRGVLMSKPRINIAADFTFGHSTCDLCILT